MVMTGAQILMECLLEQGVDTVFGYPGGTNLNVYDELYKYSDKIKNYLTSHEQGAAHAADGYARSTGKVGVCLATSGPGATNLTTGIATAHLDSSPVVFITCNVSGNLLGKDAFQEADVVGIMMPITKSTFLITDVEKLADTVREAFALARSGRPGPVLIDILKDVTAAKCEYEYLPREKHGTTGSLAGLLKRAHSSSLRLFEPDKEDVDILVDMIAQSKKPMLICGGGVTRSRAHEEFRAFARKLDSPVAITLMGGGSMPGDDPLSTGMIGMHGSQASNRAVDGCDLLIAVGTRFSDRVALRPATFARDAKIVHIDVDRAEIDKNVQTDHHIIGDAKMVLKQLIEKIPQYDHSEWKKYVFSFPTGGKFMSRFGVIPTTLPWEDIQVALQTKELDGVCWSGITEMYTSGWAENCHYFLTNNICGAWIGSYFVNSKKRIIDDCYPTSGAYSGANAAPGHYWFIRGDFYVYDQYISAYTGSAQPYAKEVTIPLTIMAEADGKMQLKSIQPNLYAYWDDNSVLPKYKSTTEEGVIIVNNVSYHKNDPISYWTWSQLSAEE